MTCRGNDKAPSRPPRPPAVPEFPLRFGTGFDMLRHGAFTSRRNPAILNPSSPLASHGSPFYFSRVASHPPDSPIFLNGQLLLADPSLRDGIFNRSVILLAEHSPDAGAMGLILNHPTGHVVGELIKNSDFDALRHLQVYDGGPVERDQLTFSALWWNHQQGLKWALRISAEEAIKLSQQPGTMVRAFIGYSGWSSGQLENELRRNAWIATRPLPDLLAYDHDKSLWRDLLRPLSPFHRLLAEAPEDPFLN